MEVGATLTFGLIVKMQLGVPKSQSVPYSSFLLMCVHPGKQW